MRYLVMAMLGAGLGACSLGTDFDRPFSDEFEPFNIDNYADWIEDSGEDSAVVEPCLRACEEIAFCMPEGCVNDAETVQYCAENCLDATDFTVDLEAVASCDPALVDAIQFAFCEPLPVALNCEQLCTAVDEECLPNFVGRCEETLEDFNVEVLESLEARCVFACDMEGTLFECLDENVTTDADGPVIDADFCPNVLSCFVPDLAREPAICRDGGMMMDMMGGPGMPDGNP